MSSQPANTDSFPTRLGRLEIRLKNKKHPLPEAFSKWPTQYAGALKQSSDPKASPVTNPQLNSSFIQRLPHDVRLMIYGQMIEDMGAIVHIHESNNSLKCLPCFGIEASTQRLPVLPALERKCHFWAIEHNRCLFRERQSGESFKGLRTYFALVLSCRKIYPEALQAIYSTVTFFFVNPFTVHHFISVTPTLQLNRIRSIQLLWVLYEDIEEQQIFNFIPGNGTRKSQVQNFQHNQEFHATWRQTCEFLSSLPSLLNLQITIESRSERSSARELLGPLRAIRGVQNFEVTIPWPVDDTFGSIPTEELPFTLGRSKECNRYVVSDRFHNYGYRPGSMFRFWRMLDVRPRVHRGLAMRGWI